MPHPRTLDNIELIEVLAYMDIPLKEGGEEEEEGRRRYHSDNMNTNTSPYVYPSPLLTSKPFDQVRY